MQLGDRIKFARGKAGLTQTELARRCGVVHATVSQLESGKTKSLSGKTLLRMAEALGRSPDWLAAGSDNGSSSEQLSSNERALVGAFRTLTTAERGLVLKVVRLLGAASEP